ncbi:polysaccharide pyruvyl transferase family protein [Ruminiclostridium herbifermentans]|uniref:Polysaccharide pyruvyl transferase family protein n=1 Tax=Ruminiclostridium herbifermentans TaxID=2488810 RepID=A0A4U7JK36_9FIRM|nr:polysaccharide pyruvyl transferase family protein [Ruminiclostridium herbifermentans]QNU66605.1 polysaccharide pyruvyl transferase family protein [Ruminiclostridium herbifermentans]
MSLNKIALMTWFHYNNFGTVLQVYALSETLKRMGFDPSVINYIPIDKRIWTIKDMLKNPMLFLNKVIHTVNRAVKSYGDVDTERSKLFDSFRKENIKFTHSCDTASKLHALNNQFDTFICGSDQIWTPTAYNSKYFLDFVNNDWKKVSYAPSMGVSSINDDDIKENMRKQLKSFKYISVREKEGREIIRSLTGQDAKVVLDPTLLLSKKDWKEIKDSKFDLKLINKPYLLCYFLGSAKKPWKSVERIAEKLGLEIVVIPVHPKDYKRSFKVLNGVGPLEFLDLFENAHFVCTDSFHGTVFSIINEKPFVVYKRFSDKNKTSQNSRIYNILSLFGLESKLYCGNDKVSVQNAMNINYEAVNKLLEEKRECSKRFLSNSIKNSINSDTVSNIKITNTCCGCGVCKAVCPQSAISIAVNNNGFLQANINEDKCNRCRKCVTVCPFNGKNAAPIGKDKDKLFMGRSKYNFTLNSSSSGGVAHELARYCCKSGYDVIGCVYDKENKIAKHTCVLAGHVAKINTFQGSKYIQSHFESSINQILNSKKAIIFGTPCQVAGIDNLLRNKGTRDNYVLVDLICHGVPSDILWKKYLDELSLQYNFGKTPDVEFRYKPKGWQKRHIKISDGDKAYIKEESKDLFFRFFKIGNCLADCCYECNFRTSSCSDIRLGDYWGKKYRNDKKGASMVLSLTQKGEILLNSLHNYNKAELIQNRLSDYWTIQMPKNANKPIFYERLLSDLKNDKASLKVLAKKYCRQYEQAKKLHKIAGKFKKNQLKNS